MSSVCPPQTEAGSESRRLAYIDGLRGLAVAVVVLFHARTWAGGAEWKGLALLSVGRAGVDLFLVLSGFCLFLPLIRQGDGSVGPLDLREYVHRRARRILPPYYAALLLSVASCGLVYRFAGPTWWKQPFQSLFPLRPDGVWDIAAHVTLTHGFNNHYAHGIEGAFWSLALEVQFYTLFPLLVWVARREYIALSVGITLLTTFAYRYLLNYHHPFSLLYYVANEVCVSRLAEFGLGMLAAAWATGAWGGVCAAAIKRHPALVVALGVLLAYTCAQELSISHLRSFDDHPYLLPIAWGVAGCLLIVCAGQQKPLRTVLEWSPLVRLGTMSFTVYLLHGSVFRLLTIVISRHPVSAEARLGLYFLVGIPLTLAVSVPFFYCFERPFLTRRPPALQAGLQER